MERIESARRRRGDSTPADEIDSVDMGRRRRYADPDDEGGIALPIEVACVFLPMLVLGILALALAS